MKTNILMTDADVWMMIQLAAVRIIKHQLWEASPNACEIAASRPISSNTEQIKNSFMFLQANVGE